MNYDELNKIVKNTPKVPEESIFVELIRIMGKHKVFIFTTLILFLGAVVAYNSFSTPLYESTILMKKENQSRTTNDEFENLFSKQSPDELETEIEMVTTNQVIGQLVNRLNLFLTVEKVMFAGKNPETFNLPLIDYSEKVRGKGEYPQFLNMKYSGLERGYSLLLKQTKPSEYELYTVNKQSIWDRLFSFDFSGGDKLTLVKKYNSTQPIKVSLNNVSFEIDLPANNVSYIEFSLAPHSQVVNRYSSNINVVKIEKTNLFEISAKSLTPYSAQLITNSIAEVFKEIRIEQQKETVKYSFNFIDSQLDDVSEKLESAEEALSSYKSRNRITQINRNSEEIINSLSSLEAQKISTDIELAEYENKLREVSKEIESSDYLDQTYLTPTEGVTDQANSPFASLLRQLSDLEVERIKLTQRKTESHPDVVNIDEQISQIKSKLGSYNRSTVTAYKIKISALRDKQAQLRDLINDYSRRVGVLPQKESRLAGLMREKNVYEKVFTMLLDKREEMRMKELSKLQDLIVADPATLPLGPSSPKKILNLILILFIWGAVNFGYLIFRVHQDKQLLKVEDVEDLLQLPILAIIPNFSRKFKKQMKSRKKAYDSKKSPSKKSSYIPFFNDGNGMKEAYKLLSTKFTSLNKKVVLVTSSEEGAGKTSVTANLGIELAMQGKHVLLIDADLKRATLSDDFGISRDTVGLINWLKGSISKLPIWNPINSLKLGDISGSINIIPAGGITEKSLELLSSTRAIDLIDDLQRSTYDYILVDSPPITRVVDTIILSRIINEVLLVVRPGVTRKDSVDFGIKELREEKTDPFGVVINACDVERTKYKHRYGYAYGYEYHYSNNGNNKSKKSKKNLVS